MARRTCPNKENISTGASIDLGPDLLQQIRIWKCKWSWIYLGMRRSFGIWVDSLVATRKVSIIIIDAIKS